MDNLTYDKGVLLGIGAASRMAEQGPGEQDACQRWSALDGLFWKIFNAWTEAFEARRVAQIDYDRCLAEHGQDRSRCEKQAAALKDAKSYLDWVGRSLVAAKKAAEEGRVKRAPNGDDHSPFRRDLPDAAQSIRTPARLEH